MRCRPSSKGILSTPFVRSTTPAWPAGTVAHAARAMNAMVASVGRMSLTPVKCPLPCNKGIPRANTRRPRSLKIACSNGHRNRDCFRGNREFFRKACASPFALLRASCTTAASGGGSAGTQRASKDPVDELPIAQSDGHPYRRHRLLQPPWLHAPRGGAPHFGCRGGRAGCR